MIRRERDRESKRERETEERKRDRNLIFRAGTNAQHDERTAILNFTQ